MRQSLGDLHARHGEEQKPLVEPQPQEGSPRVVVLIITWNRVEEALRCLASFFVVDYPNYEIVVVDNASRDGTPSAIRKDFPSVTVIENERNLGYVGGSNAGFRYALQRGADYVFLLNQDTQMTAGVLSELVGVMETDARIAVCGAKNLLMGAPGYTWGKYGKLTYGPLLVRTVGAGLPDRPEPSPKDVDWVIGNGCLFRCAALRSVGLFDDEFFHLNEDVEWCTRARKLGHRVVYVDTAAILHQGSSSGDESKTASFSYAYFLGRNAILFALKHANALQWAKLLTLMLLAQILRVGWYLVNAIIGGFSTQTPFVLGVIDGLRSELRMERITLRRQKRNPIPRQGPLERFRRWIGA
jgi:hypothetical protein